METSITHPGPFAVLSETPIQVAKRAPLLGEHNMEIYHGELGLSYQELAILKQGKVI